MVREKVDKEKAKDILTKELEAYRKQSYEDLLRLINTQDTQEVTGHSGTVYQLEFQAVWDGKKDGNLRIIGAIDDGGLRAFTPLTEGFIIAQDGSFIGE